jgi:transmembrane sensor
VDQLAVEVLGTSLNIMAYANEEQVRTTLLTGSVRVRKGAATALLQPGEQARLNPSGELKVADGVDTDGVVAWKNGYFHFDKADIRAVMRQLARWYDLEVRYEGVMSDHVYRGGIGRNLKLSEVLEVLKWNNVHFRVEGRTLTVLP